MKKEILVEIIEQLYIFDADYQGESPYSIQDFVGYLNAQMGTNEITNREEKGKKEKHIQDVRRDSNSDISILITLMFRYAKTYIKKALQASCLQTVDEFAFLVKLMTFDSLTKTELINKQVMEKTSGVEVLKRLKGKKLIREFADKQDKRSVRVAVTDLGKKEINRVLANMATVSKIVVGNLSTAEINTLSYLLKKLDFYHNDIFMHKADLSLDEILLQNQ
ncbi:MAG: MarR family winged helix-turn-helix transcriptional regulator [Thermonemataceae bacterium]